MGRCWGCWAKGLGAPVAPTHHHSTVHQEELLFHVALEGLPSTAVVGGARHSAHAQELGRARG